MVREDERNTRVRQKLARRLFTAQKMQAQKKTLTSGLAEVLFLACLFRPTGILRDKLWIANFEVRIS